MTRAARPCCGRRSGRWLIAGLAGIGVQRVMQLPQTGFAYLAAAVAGEIAVFLRVMVLPLLALALLCASRAGEEKTGGLRA